MSDYLKPAWSQCLQLLSSQLSSFQPLQVRMGTRIRRSIIFYIFADPNSSLFNIIFNPHSPSLFTRIFGLSPSQVVASVEFLTTYVISIISAALGLAKCLKNGVARPIAPGGPLDGYLTGKFLLAFLASVVILVSRGLYFCLISFFILSNLDGQVQ